MMKQNLHSLHSITSRLWTLLISALVMITLNACGGGNGPAGAPLGPGDQGPIMSLELLAGNGSGQEIVDIPPGGSGILSATIFSSQINGVPVENVLVTFVLSNPQAGTLNNSASGTTTAVTGANPALPGVATVTVLPGTVGQSSNITATATVGTTNLTQTLAFTVK